MENVIKIVDWRGKKKSNGPIEIPSSWLFDLRAFVGSNGYEGTILEFNTDGVAFEDTGFGDRLRRYADCLDQLSWYLRQQAEGLQPSNLGPPLATVLICESTARVRINDDRLVTPEQFEWLDRRLDDAKGAARPTLVEADEGR